MKDCIGNVETTYYDGEYLSSDSEKEDDSEEETIGDFEQEYAQLEKCSREMGFFVEEDQDTKDFKEVSENPNKNVNYFFFLY